MPASAHTFGKPLITNQVMRHRLVDMAMRINAVKATLEQLAWRVEQGEKPVAEICMLKNLATSTAGILRQRGDADVRRRRLSARQQGRAHLSRDQGDVDRRRLDRDHEGSRARQMGEMGL